MKRLVLYLFVVLHSSLQAQTLSGERAILMEAILDSANVHRLRDPQKSYELTQVLLREVPVSGNEHLYTRALNLAANCCRVLLRAEEALGYATRATHLARQINDPELLVRSHFIKGSVFSQSDADDSTLVYYQKAIEYYKPGMDTFLITQAYTNIGSVYASIGNEQKAEEYFLQGYVRSKGDDYSRMFVLAELIGYYAERNNPKYLPYLDTLAMSEIYQKSPKSSQNAHFELFLGVDGNMSERKAKLREIIAYAEKNGNLVNHVGYGLKLYDVYVSEQAFEQAHALLLELHKVALKSAHGANIAAVNQRLYAINKMLGRYDEALHYLETHSRLRDSLLTEESRNTISELNIRFETAQKDNEIRAQDVRLKQEDQTRKFLILIVALLMMLAILVYVYFRNRSRNAKRLAEQERIIHAQEKDRLIHEKEVAELTSSLETQERERNRIARDLHDGLGSLMSGISAHIETLKSMPEMQDDTLPHLTHLRSLVNEATGELRRTSYELMPVTLLRMGLEPALRDLCMNLMLKNGITPSIEINADLEQLPQEQKVILYRIVQELLNNIVKHAQATNVLLQCNHFNDEYSLVIEDDGKGFDVADKKQTGGLGLGSLESRVNMLKGFLDIASAPGEGTTVTVNFPG